MGYQFAHLDAYARDGATQRRKDPKTGAVTVTRKWSARDIAAEAEREPAACSHVPSPQPPRLLYGVMPAAAVQQAEAWASTARDAKGRALRRDGLCIAAGVLSLPAERAGDWPKFRASCVNWLRQQYGPRLRSVVEHTDEAHPHLHFYAVPLEGERFEVLHPGRLAAAKKAQQGAKKGAQNAAYRAAMTEWQDGFASAVAADYGLTRLGPKRRRLTRAQWQAEQAQARALAVDASTVPQAVWITKADVTKRVTSEGFFGTNFGRDYESGDDLAQRLTEVVRQRVAPVAMQIERVQRRNEELERALANAVLDANTARAEVNAALAEAKWQTDRANVVTNLFTQEEIDQALDRFRERTAAIQERERQKQARIEQARLEKVAKEAQAAERARQEAQAAQAAERTRQEAQAAQAAERTRQEAQAAERAQHAQDRARLEAEREADWQRELAEMREHDRQEKERRAQDQGRDLDDSPSPW